MTHSMDFDWRYLLVIPQDIMHKQPFLLQHDCTKSAIFDYAKLQECRRYLDSVEYFEFVSFPFKGFELVALVDEIGLYKEHEVYNVGASYLTKRDLVGDVVICIRSLDDTSELEYLEFSIVQNILDTLYDVYFVRSGYQVKPF